MNVLTAGRKVADAVLYEGYLLFPYTARARKNQLRWQFGVVVPRAYSENGNGEPWRMQTEALFEPSGEPECEVLVRFLHVESRTVEKCEGESFVPVEALRVDGEEHITWEEAREREVTCVQRGDGAVVRTEIEVPPSVSTQILRSNDGTMQGRIVRRCCALRGAVTVSVEPAAAMRKIRIEIENHSQVDSHGAQVSSVERSVALRTSFISAHTLMVLRSGLFLSLLDPPEDAAELVKGCKNQHTWPVLIDDDTGDRSPHKASAMLSSPIILYDYPAIAPQSEGDKFDGTEVDELLNLSVLSLSDEEKQNARATDERARGIIDRADQMAPEHFAKLHGALRSLESVGQRTENGNGGGSLDFGSFEAEEAPGSGCVYVNGTKIAKGSRVRLRPVRRADVWDSFLDGKTAKVAGVFQDFENQQYVAVTVDDDPASDLHDWYGRYLYFYPNEIEAMGTTA